MKLQEFNEKKTELGIIGIGITSTARTTLTWKNKETGELLGKVSPGDKVQIFFSTKFLSSRMFIVNGDFVGRTSVESANERFTGFIKSPGNRSLRNMVNSGIATTVTGCRTEIDGTGPDGSPSWFLVLGMV